LFSNPIQILSGNPHDLQVILNDFEDHAIRMDMGFLMLLG